MEIIEENGKLIRKVELEEADVVSEIETLEESIKETTDRIEWLKTFLPVEEVEEPAEEQETVNF